MLIRPRLTDYHGIQLPQADLDFAIPFLDEDIPLYIDPFLLWKSPSQQDQSLHDTVLSAFNHLGYQASHGQKHLAVETLITASECDETGLGSSKSRRGKRIGAGKADEILSLFQSIDKYKNLGFDHLEEVQLYVDGVSKDRISDFTSSILKSFLIDFTIDQCHRIGIPTESKDVKDVYNTRTRRFDASIRTNVPVNPVDGTPLLFVPKRWLRFSPWISYDNYFQKSCPQDELSHDAEPLSRVSVLQYNRDNYAVVESYIRERERTQDDCVNDPLFSQIPAMSASRQLQVIRKLETGKEDGADKVYEDTVAKLLPSLLYPDLDFAQAQARTVSGVSIRDLIFYNTRRTPFLNELYSDYGSRQITMEMKNVRQVERIHVDQVNRYMSDELGRFGVIVTRHPLKRPELKRTVDLWAGQRKALIVITDDDLAQMVDVYTSKQRSPMDVIAKKYVEFRRSCP